MTSNNDSWPNPTCPGEPAEPTKTGPHALIDRHERKVWGWWTYHPSTSSGTWLINNHSSFQGGANALASEGFKYHGQAVMPDEKINDK